MNEEAIQQAYDVFKSGGYNGSIDDYKQLISTNGNALKRSYDVFKQGGYNEDINSFKNLMGIGSIKKKSQFENGGSTLGSGSSASQKTDYSKYKKVGDKYYSGNGEIFDNYPGKEGKGYRFNDNQWYEYSSTILGDKEQIEKLDNPIKDPRRVSALNKQFNKTAVTEKGVFIGYPGKEQNEYKINNDGTWQRRTPENKTWVTVTNENSISALNNQFGQSAKKIEPEKISKIKEDNLYQSNFYANLKSINAQLIGGEEEEAVDVLRRKFPLFTFNEINAGDKIEITSPKGNKEQFTLDNWTWDKDKKISEEMIGWMEGNNLSPSEKKQYANVRRANAEEASFKYPNIGDTAAIKAMQEDMSLNLKKAINPNDVAAPSLELTQYKLEKEKANKKAKELRADWMPIKSQKLNDIVNKYSKYTSDKGNVSEYEKTRAQAALGALASDKVEIGNVNKYQEDIKYNIDSYKSKLNDTSFFNNLQNKYDNGEITEDQYNLDYTNRQKELIDQEKEIQNQIKISDGLIKNVNKSVGENYLIQETKGSLGGGLVLGVIKGVLSPLKLLAGATGRDMSAAKYHEVVKEAISPLWDFDTSLEYLRSEERSDLTKAAFSVAESLGAMAPIALSGGTTLLGTGLLARGAMTATAFYPMSYYEMKDELEEIDIPESDKVALASIYGVVSSALESIGMEYALGKIDTAIGSSIKRNILKRVLGKSLPKDAPKETIDALVRNTTKSYIASLGLGTLGAMGVEGVTESLQSLTGAGIKEIYDTANETEFFSNEGFGDIVKGALYEGYLGALGGGMVHSIYIAKDAYKRNNVLKSKELNNLLMAAKTSGMSEALMSNLKSDMLSNRITKEQAEEISNNFEIVRGMMNQMPENLTVEGQSASLSLLLEKNELNKQIEGKDPNLVKRQAARVNEINERLQEIGEKNTVENAIQEQTAGEVPVQPTTTIGEEVVQGEPTTEPQVLTEEGQKVEIGGTIRGHETISGEKSIGDVREKLPNQNNGIVIVEGNDGGQYVVAFSRKGGDGKNIFEQGVSTPRPGYISASVKIDENATPEQIKEAQQKAQRNLDIIIPTVVDGVINAQVINDALAQAESQVLTEEVKTEEVNPLKDVESTVKALEDKSSNTTISKVNLKEGSKAEKKTLGEGIKQIWENGKEVGAILLETIDGVKNVVSSVFVNENKRKEGIAKKAYLVSAIENGDIKSGEFREDMSKNSFVSNEARLLWESLNKQFNLKKISIEKGKFRYSLTREAISEAYHKAKTDGSNPELVKAVEELLMPTTQEVVLTPRQKVEAKLEANKKALAPVVETPKTQVNKLTEGFKQAGEKSRDTKDASHIGRWMLGNSQKGDVIKFQDGGYEVTEIKTKKDGTNELVLTPFEFNEDGTKDYNNSGIKIITEQSIKNGSNLFENAYTNSKGERVIEQSIYEPQEVTVGQTTQQEQVATLRAEEQAELLKAIPKMRWDDVEEYDDAVIRAMKEIQYRKLKPLRDLGKKTNVAEKEEIRTIQAKIDTADRILKRRADKIKKEAQRVEKEGKGATVRAVDNNGKEAEYSIVVSKDGTTAKVQLKKIGTLTPKRASVEANLTIQTDEKRGRFVTTANKTKVYIDEVITPAKVEPTKAKVTPEEKVEAEPVKEEVKIEAPVVEEVVEVEQYQPITIEKIFNDRFSKEDAISYDEDERENDNGRMSTYISSITMDVTNEDGDSIGSLTKLVDEDRIITWNGEDFDGNQLSEQDFDFKDDARQAIVDKWNKEQKKNFDREAKKKIKDAQKAKEKVDKAAAKEEAKSASVVKKEEVPNYLRFLKTESTSKKKALLWSILKNNYLTQDQAEENNENYSRLNIYFNGELDEFADVKAFNKENYYDFDMFEKQIQEILKDKSVTLIELQYGDYNGVGTQWLNLYEAPVVEEVKAEPVKEEAKAEPIEIKFKKVKTIEDIRQDPRVESIYKDKDGDGVSWWVDLKDGYEWAPNSQIIHESTINNLLSIINNQVVPVTKVKAAPVKKEGKNEVVLSAIQKYAYEKLSKNKKKIVDEIIADENYERSIGAVDILDENLNENQLEDEINRSAISFEDLLNVSLNISLPKIKVSETNEKFTFGGDIYDIDKANEIILEEELPIVNVPVDLLPKMSYSFIGVTESTVKNADITKPVIIVRTKDGLLLIDGHHRVRKAIIENKPIKAFVLNENQVNQIKEQSTKEAPAPEKESTEEVGGILNDIKDIQEEIDEINNDIEKARAEARKKVNAIDSQKLDTKLKSTLEDLNDEIADIEIALEEVLEPLQTELLEKVNELDQKVTSLKNTENEKTLLDYLKKARESLRKLDKLTYVKLDLGISLKTAQLVLDGLIKIVETATNLKQKITLKQAINEMYNTYKDEHPNVSKKRFIQDVNDFLDETFVEQKTNKENLQDTQDKLVEFEKAVRLIAASKLIEAERVVRKMLTGKVRKLTPVHMKSIMRRLVNFNVFSQRQYDKFIDYVDKVIGIADYDAKVNKANTNRKNAKKNIIKLGDISSDLLVPLSRVLNINAKLIPKDVFESYYEIVDMLSKRDAILELNKRADLNESIDKIIESIESNEQRVSDLKELYDNFEKVKSKTNEEVYSKTLDKMLKEGVIDKAEHELMKTFKLKILGEKGKVKKMTEQQIADEKVELIKEVKKTTITLDEIVGDEFRLERELVKRLQIILKQTDFQNLNNKELKDLLRIIDNINNGFVSNATQQMVEKLNKIKNGALLAVAIPKSLKGFFRKAANLRRKLTKDIFGKTIQSDEFGLDAFSASSMDEQLNNFKSTPIFDITREQNAIQIEKFKAKMTEIISELARAENEIASWDSFKRSGNLMQLSKFKMSIYMMQLEKNSNPNSNQVHQAMDTLNATIDFANQNKGISTYSDLDIEQMEFIKDNFQKDGEIDIDKLYKSFNKQEKDALEIFKKINSEMTKFATYTATVINGKKIEPINNYFFYNTINENKTSAAQITERINNINDNMNPTTVSKNLEERDGNVHAVQLNPFNAINISARSVLLNYYMTEPIRTTKKTFAEARRIIKKNADEGIDVGKQFDILSVLENSYDTAFSDLVESYINESQAFFDFIKKTSYRAMLGSIPRSIGEYLSNAYGAWVKYPKDMMEGKALQEIIDKDLLVNLGSKLTSRLFAADNINSSGQVDLSNITNRITKNGKTRTRVVNGVKQVWDYTAVKWVDFVGTIADELIAKPDQKVLRPLWVGSFSRAFKKETGVDFNENKIKANDEEYMDKYRDALAKATKIADKNVNTLGGNMNSFMGVLQNAVRNDDNFLQATTKNFQQFMGKFIRQDYDSARKGLNALVGNGTISKTDGGILLAVILSRQVLYTYLVKSFIELFAILAAPTVEFVFSLLGFEDDDDDDKTIAENIDEYLAKGFTGELQKLYRTSLSAITTVLLGGNSGNALRVAENYFIEKANKKYGEKIGLRDGEYDPYKNAIQFNQFQGIKSKEQALVKTGKVLLPVYSPLIGVTEVALKLALSPEPEGDRARLTRAKEYVRLGLEAAGNAGVMPFYKDIRKVAQQEVYKELSKEVKETAVNKEAKAKADAEKIVQQTSILKQMMNSGAYTREGIKKELRKIKDPEYRKAENKIEKDMLKSILDKTKYSSRTDFEEREKENAKNAFKLYDKKREESLKISNELENRMKALKYGEQYVPKKKKASGTFGGSDSFGGSSSFGGSDSFGGGDSFGGSDSFGD
jgi:hypothetical protein